jgi:hypothetical protein
VIQAIEAVMLAVVLTNCAIASVVILVGVVVNITRDIRRR